MSWYNKWDDLNRRAFNRGERDAEWGYKTCRMYDRYSECGAAYEDGYNSKRYDIEMREEEELRQQEVEARQREEQRQYEQYMEQKYYAEMEDAYWEEQWEEHQKYLKYREILFRKF